MDSYYNSSNSNTENNLNFKQLKATLALLTSSILVSISGALRVYIAALLLGTHVSILVCAASFLIIYSVYTLDRTLDSEEDEINRVDLDGAIKECGFVAVICTFLIGAWIFAANGILWLALLPFVTGVLYSKGIKIGKYSLRLKSGVGIKNLVVGLSWGLFIAFIPKCTIIIQKVIIFLLYGTKVFVNSTIDDFKDKKGDTLAGIRTLPVYLGDVYTRNLLLGLHFISHFIIGVALLMKVITFEPIIIGYGFLTGLVCIHNFTNEEKYLSNKKKLAFWKDGESTIIIILKGIVDISFA